MALLSSPGATAVSLGVAGTKRDDISDMLLASLVLAPNTIGAIEVGPEFSDSICKWVEDKLNQDTITDTTSGGQTSSSTVLNFSQSDAAVLRIGYVLADTANGIGYSEFMQVLSVQGTQVQVSRAFGGTTATTHAQSAVYAIVSKPETEASDLNNDMSRARVSKQNYVSRQSIDVIISSEALNRARRGYTPGINDELEYQFYQRMEEMVRCWDRSVIYSKPSAGQGGTAGTAAGDYSTFAGLRSWMDASLNGASGPSTTGTVAYNWATQGYGVGQVDAAINYANKAAFRNGALMDWVIVGANGAQDIGRLYSDRMRIKQDETTRGFAANVFRTLLANEFQVILDGYVTDGASYGELYLVDSGRVRIRPLADQFYGDRSGTLEDPFGHLWTLATHLEDVPFEEIARRSQLEPSERA